MNSLRPCLNSVVQSSFLTRASNILPLVPKPICSAGNSFVTSFSKVFIQKCAFSSLSRISEIPNYFLKPTSYTSIQVAGFKVKYTLRKRCKDCYFIVRSSRMFNLCPTHPRHKQMQPVKKPRYTWILTDATQSKKRPW